MKYEAFSPVLTPFRASYPGMLRGGERSVLHCPQTSTWPQVAAQTRDVYMVFGGNMGLGHQHSPLLLQSQRPRRDPQHPLLILLHSKISWHGIVLSTFEMGLFPSANMCKDPEIQITNALIHFLKSRQKALEDFAGNSSFPRHAPACEVQPFS